MKVYCKECGLVLTQDLAIYKGSIFGEADGEHYINSGLYIISDGQHYLGTDSCVIVNVSDIINLEMHSASERTNGCCGLDGTSGINKVCLNGHEVATEKSDCWMAWLVIFDSKATILK
jgi:hypothetical protein